MKDSIRGKLETTRDRFEELAGLLSDREIIGNQNRFRDLSREYARLEPVVGLFRQYESLVADIAAAEEMTADADPEVRQMGRDELDALNEQRERLQHALQKALIPQDPHDESNVFLEIRAGTGGDEAAIFAGDLFRMYARYAERMRWPLEVLSEREGEHGGYKEIVSRISGSGIYGRL
ncbi:MAG TPA: PCRF domain-containing protein, partial [Woeseiaceae bacterium]|nr:PCRF domain-containing protein [Woeseiaceae bacterium]